MSFIESRDSVLAPMAASMPGLAIGSDASLAMLAAEAAPGATAGASATPRAAPSEPRKPGAARVEVPAAAKPAATVDMQSVQRGVVFPAKDSTATVAHAGKPVDAPKAPSTAGSIGSTLFALALVIGLIFGMAWLARRMPGLRGAAAGSSLRVLGSLALSPRERLVVVAVGNTQLVLGVGAGGTRTLHTLSEPLPVAEPAGPSAFAQVLSQHFGKKA